MPHDVELDDPDVVPDEVAYAFPENHDQLPQRHAAPWGVFDKARQVQKDLIS